MKKLYKNPTCDIIKCYCKEVLAESGPLKPGENEIVDPFDAWNL